MWAQPTSSPPPPSSPRPEPARLTRPVDPRGASQQDTTNAVDATPDSVRFVGGPETRRHVPIALGSFIVGVLLAALVIPLREGDRPAALGTSATGPGAVGGALEAGGQPLAEGPNGVALAGGGPTGTGAAGT